MIVVHLNGLVNILPSNRTVRRATVTTACPSIHILQVIIVTRIPRVPEISLRPSEASGTIGLLHTLHYSSILHVCETQPARTSNFAMSPRRGWPGKFLQ